MPHNNAQTSNDDNQARIGKRLRNPARIQGNIAQNVRKNACDNRLREVKNKAGVTDFLAIRPDHIRGADIATAMLAHIIVIKRARKHHAPRNRP